MGKKITEKVTWVGKVDWELKKFHGNEYSVQRGSSYNSYLVRGKKTALIDTVWRPYDEEFISQLKQEIDLDQIDYIVMNHNEVDHSGSLPELMRLIPNTPIYCTANGEKILRGHYHQDWNYKTVKTGDSLDLDGCILMFVEAPMLHWPDTMFTYMTGDNILFSNDAFGQHYATETLFNDTVNQSELYSEAMKYYANILTPFSPLVRKKIDEVLGLNLTVNMICPSHGIIWRDDPAQIIGRYLDWAKNYQENQVTLIYDTMWQSTRRIAEGIAAGIRESDSDITVKLVNAAKRDKNDIITEVFRSRAILVGSPTINNGYLYSIGGLLEMMKGLKFKGKKAAAFGSYGWSGESVSQITNQLKDCGFQIVNDGQKVLWVPDCKQMEDCMEFGRKFAKEIGQMNEKSAG